MPCNHPDSRPYLRTIQSRCQLTRLQIVWKRQKGASILEQLKKDLRNQSTLNTVTRYYVRLPMSTVHKGHMLGKSVTISHCVDKRLKEWSTRSMNWLGKASTSPTKSSGVWKNTWRRTFWTICRRRSDRREAVGSTIQRDRISATIFQRPSPLRNIVKTTKLSRSSFRMWMFTWGYAITKVNS